MYPVGRMTATATWHGRRGSVILGPTEARVARFLDHATRSGRVTIRTVDLAARLQLERSEAYRITRRLRILGLFGIENDKAGTKGGRRYWRTATEHDGQELDETRHRNAWARVVSWAKARRARLHARLADLRQSRDAAGPKRPIAAHAEPSLPGGGSASPFAAAMRQAGLGPLMDEWGVS